MRVLISGSNGFVGQALVRRLTADGHEVVRLARHHGNEEDVVWNPDTGEMDPFALEGFNAIIHLGGVDLGEKRWTESERGKIWDSRVNTTDFLAQRIAQTINRPEVFIVASAIGYYGNRPDEQLTEESSQGNGFLAQMVKHWEEAAEPAASAGVRTVHLRSGVILGTDSGMLGRLLPVFRTALGGKLGPGDQHMSWVSLRDEVEAIVFALTTQSLEGPINVCSPEPVTNAEFTKALGEALRRPTVIPVWPWMLKLAFGEQLTSEMLLVSQRAYPKKLEAAGFQFTDRHIAAALRSITENESTAPQPEVPASSPQKQSWLTRMFGSESSDNNAKNDKSSSDGENRG